MIYSVNSESSYYDLHPVVGFSQPTYHYNDTEVSAYPIYIPKAYARGETDERPNLEDVEKIPHYKLYILNQTPDNKRDTIVIYELPSGFKVHIILYRSGGVNFDKDSRKNVLRETDELDRRIILGFCKQNDWLIRDISNKGTDKRGSSVKDIARYAAYYRHDMMAKRIKRGPDEDLEKFDAKVEKRLNRRNDYKGIFENVAYI